MTEVDMSRLLLRRCRVWTCHGDGRCVWTRQNVVEVVEMAVEARWWDHRCCLEINKNWQNFILKEKEKTRRVGLSTALSLRLFWGRTALVLLEWERKGFAITRSFTCLTEGEVSHGLEWVGKHRVFPSIGEYRF